MARWRLFRHKSKKTSKLRVTGLCAGDSPVTGEFPTQIASNAEFVSIRWHHHDCALSLGEDEPIINKKQQKRTSRRPPDTSHFFSNKHCSDVIISAMAFQITGVSIGHSTICYQRKHQSSASLAFVRGIHRWPVETPHKGPVTRKIFPFDDLIMK